MRMTRAGCEKGLGLINAVGCLSAWQSSRCASVSIPAWWWSDLVGFEDAQERGVIGESPNVAARLQAVARPNSIVIRPRTRRLLTGRSRTEVEHTLLCVLVGRTADVVVTASWLWEGCGLLGRCEPMCKPRRAT